MAENALPANVSKKKMWSRLSGIVRKQARERATQEEVQARGGSMLLQLGVAMGAGAIWARYPQVQRLGAGNGRQGIDSRLAIAVPLAIASLSPRTPRAVLDVASVFAISYTWEKGAELATR